MAESAEMSEIEASFRAHRKEILAYCLRRLDGSQAEDAVAEVFTIAWRRRTDAPDGRSQLYWLYGIARNVVANRRRSGHRLRRLRARLATEPRNASPGPEYVIVRREDELALLRAIDELRSDERELLMLINWEEVPRSEIASLLGISRKAVDQRYRRALRRLARHLGSLERSNTDWGGGS